MIHPLEIKKSANPDRREVKKYAPVSYTHLDVYKRQATDYVTSPILPMGKVIFGIGCGVFTILIRVYGSYPEGVSFAILLMNILTPHIDNFCTKRAYGKGGGKKDEK